VNETLLSIPARLVAGPQVVISGVAAKIKNGMLDQAFLGFTLEALERLVAMCRLTSRAAQLARLSASVENAV
jgi:chromate reductase